MVQYVLVTPKYKHTHTWFNIYRVSVVTASNGTLTFYFRSEMPNIFRTFVYSTVSV